MVCVGAAGGAAERAAVGAAFSPPAPHYCRVFHEGRAGPLAASAGKSRGVRLSPAQPSRYDDASESRATIVNLRSLQLRTNRARAAEIVSSWPGAIGPRETQCGGTMLRALLLLALAALAPGDARRHAPDLREDEPARRTMRPAGECTLHHVPYALPTMPADVIKCTSIFLICPASASRPPAAATTQLRNAPATLREIVNGNRHVCLCK